MKTPKRYWSIRDKNQFLLALMTELAGNAHISFEGELKGTKLANFPGALAQEAVPLKRNTVWPVQDFVVLPLAPGTAGSIISALGGSIPKTVLHIQIEKAGVLEFGSYDCFHPECFFFGTGISDAFLSEMVKRGILGPISPAD